MSTKRDKRIGKIVEIEWDDAHYQSGWESVESYQEHSPVECKTVGYLVAIDTNKVTVVSTVNAEDALNGGLSIPRGWVKSLRVVK